MPRDCSVEEDWPALRARQERERFELIMSKSHLTLPKAASVLGMSKQSLWKYLNDRGVSWPKETFDKTADGSADKRMRLYELGMNSREIAQAVDVTRKAVWIWFQRRGINIK